MRALADDLAEEFRPQGIDAITTPTMRLRAVIEHQKGQIGSPKDFLEASIDHYYQVLQLGHRQEHGNQKAGEPLTREDARRAVFQTAIVMFEVDRILAATQANNRYFAG